MDSSQGGSAVESEPDKQCISINLFGGPNVVIDGQCCEIPEGSKRLVAFAAIHRGRLERRYVAGSLWQCVDDIRAAGNLRSALWRLRGAGIDIVVADKWSLQLIDDIDIDLDGAAGWAERIVHNAAREDDLKNICDRARALDILPGCYDDWVITERERIRQRTLHALEAVSRLLTQFGRCGEAVEAAMLAVFAEPLRESAQCALIEAHLGERNLVEARRSYQLYEKLLMRELGVAPSPSLAAAVRLEPARGFTSQRQSQLHPEKVAVNIATRQNGVIQVRGTQRSSRVG
jgi:DNA-binding SARP family transcriptional activator